MNAGELGAVARRAQHTAGSITIRNAIRRGFTGCRPKVRRKRRYSISPNRGTNSSVSSSEDFGIEGRFLIGGKDARLHPASWNSPRGALGALRVRRTFG